MEKIEFSRELRYQVSNYLIVAIIFFMLGQLWETSFDPKPIVVKLELPVSIDSESIGDRPSVHAASGSADLPGAWPCPVTRGEGSWK